MGLHSVVFLVLVVVSTHELVHFRPDPLELLHFPCRLISHGRLLVDSILDVVLKVSHLFQIVIVELVVPAIQSI